MSKELVKKEQNEVAVPDYLKQFQGEGADDISSDMLEKSFLSVSHSDTDDVKLGEFYDSATGESYGNSVVVTVCKITRSWRKFNDDFQLESISKDGITWDNGKKLEEDEKWQCAFIDMFVLLNDADSNLPFIVSFKSTSYRTGKKLSTAIAKFTKGNGEPMFARNYTLYTEEAKKGSKSYAVMKYKLNQGFNSEGMVTAASKARNMVKDIEPDMTDLQDAEPSEESSFDFGDNGLD